MRSSINVQRQDVLAARAAAVRLRVSGSFNAFTGICEQPPRALGTGTWVQSRMVCLWARAADVWKLARGCA